MSMYHARSIGVADWFTSRGKSISKPYVLGGILTSRRFFPLEDISEVALWFTPFKCKIRKFCTFFITFGVFTLCTVLIVKE